MATEHENGAGQWLTYGEIAEALGKSVPAAQQLARRRKWQRQPSNHPHNKARFWVPEGALVATEELGPEAALLGRAWDALFRDLERSGVRIDALTKDLERSQDRIDALQGELASVRAQERERDTWSLIRRVLWALRRPN